MARRARGAGERAGERAALLPGGARGAGTAELTMAVSSRRSLCAAALFPLAALLLFSVAFHARLAASHPRMATVVSQDATRRSVVFANKRDPPGPISQAWTHEEAYAEVQLQALGAALLRTVNASGQDGPEPSCGACDPTPFYIDPNCAAICRAAHDQHARHQCWLCRHWAVSLKSELGAAAPRYTKVILDLPVLTHVASLATTILGGSAEDLSQTFNESDHAFALEGEAVVAAVATRLAGMHKKLHGVASSGGGGGMGLQVYCNASLLLSVGGGGGQGYSSASPASSTSPESPVTSFGGGRGAGFQVFNAATATDPSKPPAPAFSFGGGAGGGLRLVRTANATRVSSSAGSAPDRANETVSQDLLDDIRARMRHCWAHGNLTVVGGGGLGGGANGSAKGTAFAAHGDIAFRFQAFQDPCPVHCAVNHLPKAISMQTSVPKQSGPNAPPAPSPLMAPSADSCDPDRIANLTVVCAQECNGRAYQGCMCPCFRRAYSAELDCAWAKHIHCASVKGAHSVSANQTFPDDDSTGRR